jgi:hypothetical protein
MAVNKICLNMIVKNESKIIIRCFESLKSIVDYIVVTDTGSTDNTVELMNKYLVDNNIEGKIYYEPWKNFGYNRTNSIMNAKNFFKEKGMDTENIFLLLVDADMIIEILDTSFKNTLHHYDHYLVEQYNPAISYYNTRVMCLNRDITCRGVTHEYYDIKTDKRGTLKSIRINDIGDGGAKNDKFERDIRLLHQGIDDEPNNERYHFYLAESYKNCGKPNESIFFYKKRIEFGGWFEEIYMSHLRLGNIYEAMNDWKNAFYHYLEGWTVSRNERAESLYQIINYYKNKPDHKLAYMFLKELLQLKYPTNHYLFIDYNVHGYKKYELLTIVAYYVGKIKAGLYGSQVLLLNKKYKFESYLYENIHRNLKFYISKLNSSNIIKLNNFQNINNYRNSSSSIYYDKNNGYEGIVRTVNYSMNDTMCYSINDGNHINTENFFVKLNENFSVVEQNKINIVDTEREKIIHPSSQIKGLEDMRYINFKGEKYGLCVSLEYGVHGHPSIILCKMDDEYNIVKIVNQPYNNNICQKNWGPVIYEDNLCFVYSYEPFILLKMNEETMILEEYIKKDFSAYNLSKFRGSSNYLFMEKEKYYLCIVHEVITDNPRKYTHRFLKFDMNLNLIDISVPFYFVEFFVEFVLSLDYNCDEDCLIIPFSIRDNDTYLCKLKLNNIEWMDICSDDIENKICSFL